MRMAYLNFYADGAYSFKESGDLLIIIQEHLLFGLELVNGWKSIHAIGHQRLMELEFHNNRQLFLLKNSA